MKTRKKTLTAGLIIVAIFALIYLFFNNIVFAENIYGEGRCSDHTLNCQPGTCTDYDTFGGSRYGCKTPVPTATSPPTPTPWPTAIPRPLPTSTPVCNINDVDEEGRCINCTEIRVPQKSSCDGKVWGYVNKHSDYCGASDACDTGYTPPAPTSPPAATNTPAPAGVTTAPGVPTAVVRAPTARPVNQGNQNPAAPQAVDTTCQGTLDMVSRDSTCEYKSTWKMSVPEGGGKCEVWLRSAISGELTQMVDGDGAPITNCDAQAESSGFNLNSGEDFDLVVSNGKSECTNKVAASKKCEVSASPEPSGGDEPPPEEPAPVVGPAIEDNKCTDAGFTLDGEEYGQCGGDMHNTCDEASDGKADDNEELVVKRYKNEDGELRYLTQNRGKTPGVCGNPVPTPRPAQNPTAGENRGKPGSKSSGNPACKIGSQSPGVSDACAQCIGMAQHVKPMDPGKFNVCSDTQVTNYWCNGGVSEPAKNDCVEAKQKKCAAQCAGPTATTAPRQPTNTPIPGVPTATPGAEEAGGLPADIAALDGAEPIGCIGTSDLSKVDASIGAGRLTRDDHTRLLNFYRSSSQAVRKFLCSEIKQNP